MPTFAPVPDQLALIESGVVDFLVRAELAERLQESRKTGGPPRIKAGFDPDPSKVETPRNSDWLDKLSMVDAIELMAKSTVSRMLERKDFRKRFDEERPIHQHEFLYPLLQAYDSVALECDVELGGTDQLFNVTLGRDLMSKYGKRPQIVMTTPILEGTDARFENGIITGKKMSKSADNYIGLQEDPLAMFRMVMQIDDEVIFRFFQVL